MGKNHETKVPYDKDEYEKVKAKAKKLGLKVSQYVRMTSLHATTNIKEKEDDS